MFALWNRIRAVWRKSGEQRDENVIHNALQAHEAAEREKHTDQPLPPGRGSMDSTYVDPFS